MYSSWGTTAWKATKNDVAVTDIVKEIIGENSIADFIDIVLDVDEDAVTEQGNPSVSVNGTVLPAIVGDILKVDVNDILGFIDGEGDIVEEILDAIVGDEKTLEYYLGDVNPELAEKLEEKEALKPIIQKPIKELVTEIIEDPVEALKDLAGETRLGDFVDLIKDAEKEDGDEVWTLEGEPVDKALDKILDISVNDILNWVENDVPVVDIVEEIFEDTTIAEIVGIGGILDVDTIVDEDGNERVTIGGSEKLNEKLCVRPTSETLFCEHYAKIINTYRDLPKLYNQWCSVVR